MPSARRPLPDSPDRTLSVALATLVGPGEPYPFLGGRVEASDDVDGDGVPDLLLNATGATWIVPATVTGEHPIDDVATTRFTSGGETDEHGYEQDPVYVHAVGDLDGDGLADVAVTVFPEVLSGWTEYCWTGDVLLYTDPGPGDRVPSDADATLRSLGESGGWDGTLCQQAGTSVVSLGDMDGDGRADLAVGAPRFWVGRSYIYRDALPGRVYVWTGPVDGTRELKESIAIIEGDEDVQYVGQHVTGPGDVDGDGQVDLLAGALLYQGPLEGALGVADARPASSTRGATASGSGPPWTCRPRPQTWTGTGAAISCSATPTTKTTGEYGWGRRCCFTGAEPA